jgi:hypothetical protein
MRFGTYICLLFLLVLPWSTVFAQTPAPSYINIEDVENLDGCGEEDAAPGARCRVDGDLPNPTFIPGSDKGHCEEVEVEVTNPITGNVSTVTKIECVNQRTHIRQDNFIWSSEKDAGNYPLFYLDELLEKARLPLTPKALWDVTTRNTNPQMDSWIARGCTYSRQTGQPTVMEKNELSKQLMTLEANSTARIVENLEHYKSIRSTAKNDNQYYQKATELVRPSTAYDCGYERDAVDILRAVRESGGKAEFTLLEIIKKTILFVLEETSGTFKVITETGRKPFSETILGGMKQLVDEELQDSRISEERQNAIKANAGIVESFRPCSVSFEEDIHGEVNNEYEWEATGETFAVKSRQHEMARTHDSKNFFESTFLPASVQSEAHKKQLKDRPCGGTSFAPGPITSNVNNTTAPGMCTPDGMGNIGQQVGNSSTAPTSVTAAANAAGIPDCVLNGVYQMESSGGTNVSCTPNVCGAVGAFGITVGFTGSMQNGQCSQNTDCSACAAGYCPNAIAGTGLTAADMCDTGKAAAFAASLLKGKAGYFGQNLSGTNTDITGSTALQDAIIAQIIRLHRARILNLAVPMVNQFSKNTVASAAIPVAQETLMSASHQHNQIPCSPQNPLLSSAYLLHYCHNPWEGVFDRKQRWYDGKRYGTNTQTYTSYSATSTLPTRSHSGTQKGHLANPQ